MKLNSSEVRLLDRLNLKSQVPVSKELLWDTERLHDHGPMDFVRDQATYELTAHVYEDQSERLLVRKRLAERTVHPDWKHALVASLPEVSVRRAFLAHWWGIEPGYVGTRRWVDVDLRRLAIYPTPEVPVPGAGPLLVRWYDHTTEGEEA